MKDVLISGKTSFKIEVPYKLIETGEKTGQPKPLILYLHGFEQNISFLEKKAAPLTDLEAYHLFVQGPYPVYDTSRKKKVSKWGRAWYLYDGGQGQFIKSMEISSEFIQEIIDDLNHVINISRFCVVGYSMGAYLAGYFAFSRWKYVNDLVAIGGRIKIEAFEGRRDKASHLNILALHGKDDSSVFPEPQKEGIDKLKKEGFKAEFKLIDAGHHLDDVFISETEKWLIEQGYKLIGR
ncbi:alpha/beta hydrolase [Balneola sp. MJW-20]|uniref:alpha/beta hydrolase n=1 Tax=Gracilimonas aurantiaca TaxID=3234185 RepID=UPI003465D339